MAVFAPPVDAAGWERWFGFRAQPDWVRAENVAAQAPGISIAHMVGPALHAGVQFGEGDRAAFIQVNVALQPAREIHGIAPLQPAVCRVDDEAQPGDAIFCLRHLRTRRR